MFTCSWVLKMVFLVTVRVRASVHRLDDLTCELFEESAYFDPYQTLDSMWKIFYFWGNTTEAHPIMFNLPKKEDIDRFRFAQAEFENVDIPWGRASLMMDPRPGIQVLLIYQGTVGSFRALIKLERRGKVRPHQAPWIKISDIRMKMVGRYIGMMACEEQTGYALARIHELPDTEAECETEAATLGFPLGGGRSYLYVQGLLNDEKEDKDEL